MLYAIEPEGLMGYDVLRQWTSETQGTTVGIRGSILGFAPLSLVVHYSCTDLGSRGRTIL